MLLEVTMRYLAASAAGAFNYIDFDIQYYHARRLSRRRQPRFASRAFYDARHADTSFHALDKSCSDYLGGAHAEADASVDKSVTIITMTARMPLFSLSASRSILHAISASLRHADARTLTLSPYDAGELFSADAPRI